MFGNDQVTDFLKGFSAYGFGCLLLLLGETEMGEKAFIGISFLVGSTAYFLDDGEVVSAGLYGKSFIVNYKRLIVVNEQFGQLTEGNVFGVEFLLNKFRQGSSGIKIGGVCSFCPVYPDTFTEFLADDVRHCLQGHLCFGTSLKQIFDLFLHQNSSCVPPRC